MRFLKVVSTQSSLSFTESFKERNWNYLGIGSRRLIVNISGYFNFVKPCGRCVRFFEKVFHAESTKF